MLSAVALGVVVALSSMLAVSWVISQQYLDQSNALLRKSSVVINDSLNARKNDLLTASIQLAGQKNIGSTIWYLAQYAQSDVDSETLFGTYQQLAKDTYRIGRAAKLSRIAIYNSAGNLVSFALFDNGSEQVGFVERLPVPLFRVATLKDGEELSRQNLRETKSLAKIDFKFAGELPRQANVHYAVVDGLLAIESKVPIMGEAFDPDSGKQETRQLGLVVTAQPLDQFFVDSLSRMIDVKINIFTPQGFSSGEVAAYQHPDWRDVPAGADPQTRTISFNEIVIAGAGYYQSLIPLYTDKHLVGTIAALHSKEIVRKNILEMILILGLIALASLLLTIPLVWHLTISISHPLTTLTHIFHDVASGKQISALSNELSQLEKEKKRDDELGDLTQSFIAMNDAVTQKIQQISEINASLEHKVEERTGELRFANEKLTKLATHDSLTGLPNRNLLSDRLQQALATARRDNAHIAVMFIDLDEFKSINDMHGHAIGDKLLKEAAKRTQDCMRESDTVSRIGGDEFIVLLPTIEAEPAAMVVAEKIRMALSQPFELAGKSLCISSSIGIAIYPEHGSTDSELLKNADTAMYYAKEGGRNAVRLYATKA